MRVALTFEAGGDVAPAQGILAALREAGARATFFVDGRWGAANPELVRAIAADGHELGNHGYDHPDWTTLPDERVARDLEATDQLVHELTGAKTRPWARPPFGALDDRVLAVLAANGYRAFYRDAVDGAHWPGETTVGSVAERALFAARSERVVVFHTNRSETEEALPAVLAGLRGAELVTLSELGAAFTPRPALHTDFAELAVSPGYVCPTRAGGRWHSVNVLERGAAALRPAPSSERLADLDGASLDLLCGSGDEPWLGGAAEHDRYLLVLAGELRCDVADDGYVLARAGDLFLWPAGCGVAIESPRRWVGLVWSAS